MDSGWFLGSPIVSLDYAATLERWLRKQALANTLPDIGPFGRTKLVSVRFGRRSLFEYNL